MMVMMNEMSYIFGFKYATTKLVDATLKVMLKFDLDCKEHKIEF